MASFYRQDKSSSSAAIVSHSGYGTCAHIVTSLPRPYPRTLPVGKQTQERGLLLQKKENEHLSVMKPQQLELT